MTTRIELLSGPCRLAKTETLLDLCRERMRAGRENSFILIVPSPERAEQATDQLLDETRHGCFKPFVGTFNKLIQGLYQMLAGRGAPISAAVKAALIRDILASDPSEFPYLGRQQGREPFPGLVARLCGFVSELKRNLIEPTEFAHRAADLPKSQRDKASQLAGVYRAYQDLLLKHGLMDGDGVFWLLRDALQAERGATALRQFDLLMLDGIHDLTRAEWEVLRRLMACMERTVVAIDYWPQAGPLGEAAKALYDDLVAAGGIPIRPRTSRPAAVPSHAPALEAQLFALPSKLKAHGRWPCQGALQVYRCADRQHEVKTIASAIKSLAQDTGAGLDLSRVCVAVPDLSQYTQLIREVFPRYGIPFDVAAGLPLAQAPVAAAAMSLLRTVIDAYPRRAVVNCLRSPFLRFQTAHMAEPLDADVVDRLSRDAGILRGREHWRKQLTQHLASLKQQAAAAQAGQRDDEGQGDPGARLHGLCERCAQAEQALPGILDFLDLLSVLEPDLEPDAFRAALATVLGKLNFQQQVVAGYTLGLAAADIRRDTAALDRFWRCLDSVVFSLGFSERRRYSARSFNDMLAIALAETSYRPERRVRGVQIVSVRDTRALDMDRLFLAGMAEGEFPRARGHDVFFSEPDQKRLGLKVEPYVEEEDRHLFYQCLVRPRTAVCVLWPEWADAKDALRSPFIDELLRVCDVEEGEPQPPALALTAFDFQVQLGRALVERTESPATRDAALELLSGWAADDPARAHNVVRSLRIRDERADLSRLSRFQGGVTTPAALARVGKRWALDTPFSISQLECYGQCPFVFFMERMLGLAEPEEPSEDLSARTRGDMVHHVLRRYYAVRRERGRASLDDRDDAEAEKGLIKRIARQVLDELPREGLFWEVEQEAILGPGQADGRPGLLDRFIDVEQADASLCRPSFFEVTFGDLGRPDAMDRALRLPTLALPRQGAALATLVGRIDRIDVADTDKFLVMDYKTGSTVPRPADVRAGVSLQLPVYIMAVQGDPDRAWQPVGGVYYRIRDLSDFGKKLPIVTKSMQGVYRGASEDKSKALPDEEFDALLGQCEHWVVRYAQCIRAGKFPPMSHKRNQACLNTCPYRDVCRVDPARMSQDTVMKMMDRHD